MREKGGVLLGMQLFGPEFSQPESGPPDCYLDMGLGRGLLELGSRKNMHG